MTDVRLPDGSIIRNVPDGITQQELMKRLGKHQEKADYKRGLTQSLMQGVTLGFSDEITAALAAVPAAIATGASVGDAYKGILEGERSNQKTFAEENPKTAFGAELAGGLVTGGAGASKVLGSSTVKNLPKLTKYAIGGAVPGAIYGAGAAEDGRVAGAAQGAALGGAFGAGLPLIGKGAWKVASWTGEQASKAFQTVESKSLRNIQQAFERDSVSIDQARKNLADLGDQATLGDIGGPNVNLLAEDLANKPGASMAAAKQVLTERGKGQGNRIIEAVKSKLSSKSENVIEAADEIRAKMRTKASPLYDEAYATPIDNSGVLGSLKNNPVVSPLLKKAVKKAKSDVELPDHLKAGLDAENPNLVVWDYVKRLLDDKTGAAVRGGKADAGRITTGIKKRLVTELDSQVPVYGKARTVWQGGAKELDALEQGTNVFRNLNKDADFTLSEFKKLSESEQELFRLGAGKTIINMVRGANDTLEGMPAASMMKSIFGSPAKREVLKAIFPDQKDYADFAKLMKAEGTFHANTNKVLANSRTAIRQAARQDSGIDPNMAGDVANVLTGDLRGVPAILSRFKKSGRKTDPQVDAEMAQRFFTTDAKTIKDTLNALEQRGNILPQWAQSVLKMKPKDMGNWLKNEKNRNLLEGYVSGGSGTAGVAVAN